ncbi:MAG: hypothetical protein ACE5FT_01010 [Candidatus Nanoarchaeia archaeon]
MDADLIAAFRAGYEQVLKLDSKYDKRLPGFMFLYSLRLMPYLDDLKHRPDLQKKFLDEVEKFYRELC